MTLVAPTDGHVIKRDGEIGELIAPTQALFWISSSSALRISTDVDEEDVARVQAGQDVLIRADAFPGQIFKGKVESITPKGDPVARTYRVRIHLNELTPLMIGMTAETNIIIHQNPNALLVPNGSIVGSKVWLIKDGTLESRQVRVGSKGTSDSEVISGLSETDVIVLNPSGSLREGSRARSTSKDWKV
jgi:RND family efflux transporter MFP subunit